MAQLTINQERCKACHYCIAACPKKALSISEYTNIKGHRVVTVDTEKCVACGICFIVCPDYVYEVSGSGA